MAVQTHSGRILQFTRCLIVLGMTLTFATLAGTANAANLTLAWDANSEPDLTGYRVYCGETSGHYAISHDITSSNPYNPPPTTYEFTGLKEGTTYYLAAKAISQTGESAYSQEISYAVPATPVDPQDIDNDGDGYTENDDCNDTDSSINPDATDVCGDGIDQDCNGADLDCPDNNSLIREVQYGELEGNFKSVDDSAAASGQYVYVPEGDGNLMDGPDENQKVTFTFNIPARGTYRIKGTVYASNGSSDSFWVKVNGNPAGGYLWDVLQNTSYQQDYVNDRNGADPVEVTLDKGPNSVAVYLREDGTRLERIELEPVAVDPQETDDDGDGYTESEGDCNDNDETIYSGAEEVCGDGIDQNCDGSDIDCKDIDDDGDKFTENQGDCDDKNPGVFPGATETCGDGIDQDCDGNDSICVDYDTDTDNDGLTDYEEENTYLTDPHKADTDQDGLTDYEEGVTYFTDPNKADSDGDMVTDGEEIAAGFDPNNAGSKPDPRTFDLTMEVGVIEVDGQWKTVSFDQPFDVPVVIANGLSYSDQDPAVTRIRNVTRNGFEVRVQEWDYLDGNHPSEKVNYVVVESGTYELPGGTRVEAGRFSANAVNSFDTVQFKHSFSTVPVVITSTTTTNENDALAIRLKNITTTKFDYCIQEQEKNSQQHASEETGYVAWEPSAGSLDNLVFEIGRTSNSVTHEFQALNFYEPFSSPPVFVAGMQTTDGSDTAAVRCQNKQADGIEIKVEEEQSRDTDMNHTTEVIGYMVFEADNPVQDDDTQPVDSLVREAEDGVLSGGFDIGNDAAASGGQYVHVSGWSWSSTPDETQKVEYTFHVSSAGYYRIKAWVYAPDSARDSFFVKVNGNPAGGYTWHVLQNTTYAQDYVRDGVGGNPVEIWLDGKEPTITVTVYQREAQTRLDKIELELVK